MPELATDDDDATAPVPLPTLIKSLQSAIERRGSQPIEVNSLRFLIRPYCIVINLRWTRLGVPRDRLPEVMRLVNQRVAPSSLESRACLFDFDLISGQLSAWISSQGIYQARDMLAKFLGIDRGNIRVYNAEVGGAFGDKTRLLGEEIVAALLAVKLARPVKWIESRSENLQAQSQGRGQVNYIEAAFQNDGRLLGLRVHSLADLGAFLAFATAMVPGRVPSMLCGPYQLQALESKMVGVFTNKATTAPYRGAGRPEAAYILERTMDRIAHELGLDPVEVRRRNLIAPGDFPSHCLVSTSDASDGLHRFDLGGLRVINKQIMYSDETRDHTCAQTRDSW